MQVLKPLALGLNTRPVEFRGRMGLSVAAVFWAPFDPGPCGRIGAEQSMWKFLAQEMALPLIDEGMPKLTSEFLVHGSAYPPQAPAQACAVRAQLGTTAKTVHVYGDRIWNGSDPSAPLPFDRMPLDWAHAYGGPEFPHNPAGKGQRIEAGVQPLANLQMPDAAPLRPDQPIAPAGLAALEPLHPQRAAFRGTYDEHWLKTHSPGFPPDLDWRHFNLAPQDQWLSEPLRGDEAFALDHMHPTQPHLRGQLPGWRVRAFFQRKGEHSHSEGGPPVMRELPMRMTTVWFFPHAKQMVLLSHGLIESKEDDASDILCLMGGVEHLERPKPDAHYAHVMEKRLDPVGGGLESLNEADLLPEGVDYRDEVFEEASKAFELEGLQAEAQYRRAELQVEAARAASRARGLDPDSLGIRLPPRERRPALHELPAYLESKRKEIQVQQWALIEQAVELAVQGLRHAVRDQLPHQPMGPVGPPQPRDMRGMGAREAALMARADRMGYLQTAHLQPPAPPRRGEEALRLKADLRWMLQHGLRHFAGVDFTGADLSGIDLRAADFTDAWLEAANLRQANLCGTCFKGAVLAHANLEQAVAIGTDFSLANLGRASLAGAVFDESVFTGATLAGCDFSRTQAQRAELPGLLWLDTVWDNGADWSGARLAGATTFLKRDLRALVLAQASLDGAQFIECDLRGMDLRHASLKGASFVDCRMQGALMAGANLAQCAFVKNTSLAGADFTRANLAGANLAECDAHGAIFLRAVLDGAHLSLADLRGCDLRLASVKQALLRKSRLARSRLAGANFREAILQRADLRGCDLRHANLYGADLTRVRLDADAQFDGALLERARTWPRLSPEQQAALNAEDPS